MSKQLDLTELAGHVAAMTCALAAYSDEAGTFDLNDYAGSRQRQEKAQDALKERLIEMGARVNARPAVDVAITLGGVRSSSTGGIHGACTNWLNAATRRVEAGR